MTKKELHKIVNDIIDIASDAEAAHGQEDDLHLDLIKEFCPDWVVKEIERLSEADFARWCA